MPLSDLDRQLLLIQDVGDVDPATGDPVLPTAQGSTGIVMRNIGRLWQKYADKLNASNDPRLRDLYVQLEAHDLVMGVLERLIDFSTNNGQINLRLSQRFQAHKSLREAIVAEIQRLESLLADNSGSAIAAIAQYAPITPPVPGQLPTPSQYGPDANNPRYFGSPYWPPTRVRP